MRKEYMMSKGKMICFDDSELFDNSDFDAEALFKEIEEEDATKEKTEKVKNE